jgi:3-hydroxyacyl-CoA dehydrogenase
MTRVLDEKVIFERIFFPIINEGFKILETSNEYSPEEVDYICVQKFGWPRIKGGPMLFAEREMKLADVLLSVIHYDEKSGGKERWKPSELLREVVRSGSSLKEELYFRRQKAPSSRSPSTNE